MKWLVIFLFGAILVSQPLPDASSIFEQANAAYSNDDYQTAVSLYETLVASGFRDANLYLNLGNAYFELDNLGEALLNYKRAHELSPRDPQITENVMTVRSTRIDIFGDEQDPLVSLASSTNDWLTLSELNLLTWLVGCLSTAGYALWFVKPVWKIRLRAALIALSILFVISLVLLVSRAIISSSYPEAVITANVAQVMSGPSQDYLEIFNIHAAAEVRLVDSRNGWIRFKLSDGRGGWIQQGNVEQINP